MIYEHLLLDERTTRTPHTTVPNRSGQAGFTTQADTHRSWERRRPPTPSPPSTSRRPKSMRRQIYERFLSTLRDGDRTGDFHLTDPVATTFAIIAMCEHVDNYWVRPGGRLDPDAIADEYVVLAHRMVDARTD
ncbi:hypothetical protein [Saccharopolyspora shandongensis]|uniref:hypothetical protein n=1 Tax=Saccharopolyspora shandongensis TaxID=418495 RepID=UPI00340BEA1D